MTFDAFKDTVQTLFPFKFEKTLMYDEDPAVIDKILKQSLSRAVSKFEKIEKRELIGSQQFDRASSILKCTYNAARSSAAPTVWDTMNLPNLYGRVKHYFGPDKYLRLWPQDAWVYIEYVVDTKYLTVDDLTDQYVQWAVDYAVALLKIKEGYLGTQAIPTALPFEFNYSTMLSNGEQAKGDLEKDLDDMYSGVLAIRIS